MKNIMITGDVGTGKSTLLSRLLNDLGNHREVYGFRTEKVTNGDKFCDIGHVYIFPATGDKITSQDNCIAELTGNKKYISHSQVFETIGVQLLSDIPRRSLVVMDEIGFLESQAPKFSAKIMEIIHSESTVIGVIKPTSTPLLDQIRHSPNTDIYLITKDNRDSIYELIREQIRRDNEDDICENISGCNPISSRKNVNRF